jgi:hypothetical protein
MDMLYIDTSDLGVEWLEELHVRTKVSSSNLSTAYHEKSHGAGVGAAFPD